MELLFWIDAFKRASATQVTAVIPYFSYAKGDKKDEPRVSIRARVCADCIEAAGADRVLTMDLHSPQIQGFFKIPVDHLYAMPVLVDYFRAKQIPDLVVAAPDVGFGKQAYKFGEMMNAPVVFGNKTRRGHDEKAEMLDIVGQVEGKNVLIVDDFTISGGTLIEMAVACKQRGRTRHLRLRLPRRLLQGIRGQDRPEPDQGTGPDRHHRATASSRWPPAARSSASPACSPTRSSRSTAARASAASSTIEPTAERSHSDVATIGRSASTLRA